MTDELVIVLLSLQIAAVATLCSAPFALLFGTVLARWRHPLKVFLESILMAPLVLPPVVTGYFLLWLLGIHGPVGQLLERYFGLRFAFSSSGAILAGAVVGFPLFVRGVKQGVEGVNTDYEAVASTLGLGAFSIWRRITIPLAWRGLLSGAVLAFSRSLGEFGATIVFAGNVEGETRTLPLAIFSLVQAPGGEAAALRLVLLSCLLAVGSVALSEWLSYHRAEANREALF